MKKYLITALIMAGAVCAFARDANLQKYVSVLPAVQAPPDDYAGATTSAAVDIHLYKGNAAFLIDVGGTYTNATITNICTLTHATTSGGSYTTITNTAGLAAVITTTGVTDTLTRYPCDLARLHKYIKAAYTTVGTNTSCAVIMVAPMKQE